MYEPVGTTAVGEVGNTCWVWRVVSLVTGPELGVGTGELLSPEPPESETLGDSNVAKVGIQLIAPAEGSSPNLAPLPDAPVPAPKYLPQ